MEQDLLVLAPWAERSPGEGARGTDAAASSPAPAAVTTVMLPLVPPQPTLANFVLTRTLSQCLNFTAS